MSGLETAIRTALENTDRHNANQRARVYQSAREALERGLANQNIREPGAVARQRRRLDDIITAIEQEEAAAARKAREAKQTQPLFDDPFAVGRTPERQAPSLEDEIGAITPGEIPHDEPHFDNTPEGPDARFDYPESPVLGPAGSSDAGFTEAGFSNAPRVETGHIDEGALPAMDDIAMAEDGRMPLAGSVRADDRPRRQSRKQKKAAERAARYETKGKPVRKRRFFSSLMIAVVVLALLFMGGWWMVTSNFAFNPERLDTAVPNPAPRIEAEDFEGASGWTSIYEPGTANVLSAGPRASIAEVTVDDTRAAQITSNAEGDAGAVAIALPVAVRGMLENGPVLIEISALAPDGAGQPVAIYCADGTIEGCQRHRFTASAHRDSLVIRLDPARGVLPTRLMLSSDINGTGAPLDIFAIRARTAE